MDKQFYFLSPVEVVKVTSQNLEEVAEWCGGSVQETESRRVKGRMDKYVLVPTPSEKNISCGFPGMYVTKRLVVTVKDELRATYAVFRRDYFDKNYFDTPKDATDKTWERAESEKTKKRKPKNPEVHVTVNVGDALIEAQKQIAFYQAKEADRVMARKSDAELKLLVSQGTITEDDMRRHKGQIPPVPKPAEKVKLEGEDFDGETEVLLSDPEAISTPAIEDLKKFVADEIEGRSESEVEAHFNGVEQ